MTSSPSHAISLNDDDVFFWTIPFLHDYLVAEQSDVSEMLLLGAGASKDAGIPTAYEMSLEIAKRFEANWQTKEFARIVTYVIGGLLFKEGIKGNNPLTAGVNVEDLFNAVQLLAERDTLAAR